MSKPIFNSEINSQNQPQEVIFSIHLTELHAPDFTPFVPTSDNELQDLTESIRQYGVREPCIARLKNEGGYELLCGNRRKRACEILEIETLPCLVRELSDDESVLTMIDSNLLHRELIPSEKAWAYRLKMETLKSMQTDKYSHEILCEQTGESKNQIYRYIRLTELVPILLDMVDRDELAFTPAVELSYLTRTEQTAVADFLIAEQIRPTLSQAQQLKIASKNDELTASKIVEILSDFTSKRKPVSEVSKFKKFFPRNYTQEKIEVIICSLLENWKKGVQI